jgi:hypothetical protein
MVAVVAGEEVGAPDAVPVQPASRLAPSATKQTAKATIGLVISVRLNTLMNLKNVIRRKVRLAQVSRPP